MGNTDQELEELEALCEEWEIYTNQGTEFDVYGDNAFEGE